MNEMKLLSIIVPCFNEEQAIMLFYHEIKKVVLPEDISIEFLFVDDGSSDGTIVGLQKDSTGCSINTLM